MVKEGRKGRENDWCRVGEIREGGVIERCLQRLCCYNGCVTCENYAYAMEFLEAAWLRCIAAVRSPLFLMECSDRKIRIFAFSFCV